MKKIHQTVDKIFSVLLGLVTITSLTGLVFELVYLGRAYPGLEINQQKIGGFTAEELKNYLTKETRQIEQLDLVWGVNNWKIEAGEIGLNYDVSAAAIQAINYGRTGNLLEDLKAKQQLFKSDLKLKLKYTLDEEKLTNKIGVIADQVDIPAKEPEINIINGEVIVAAGENGQLVNREELERKIKEQIANLNKGDITLPVTEVKPKLSDEQMRSVKETAQRVIGKKVIFENGDEKWEVGQEQLLSWLDLKNGGWKNEKIKSWLTELATAVNRPPQNASFRYMGSGKVEEFKPAQPGLELEVEATTSKSITELQKLTDAGSTEITVKLEVKNTSPEVENHEVNTLGIKELIGKGESWYSGSINNRIFNLKKASESINGILVAPDEIFSFNKAVGDVSASTGYKQAYIIKEGKTILGDGGGVCQVSSTLFRAILAAGLPIVERTAHAYRVHYYEEKYQVGFDATVFQPSPDFKFKNDTGKYILIQMVYDEKAKYLAFEIYGTSDGRKVETSKSRIWELTAPPPDLYQDDPTLPVGKVVQTEHAAWGAKVAFDWKVTRGDEVLQDRTFYSNYKPWQAVYLRGTKPL
jgi:vancomycin resistance protein YoaR